MKIRKKVACNFWISEFVQKNVYETFGAEKCLQFIDPRIIMIAQAIRDMLGTIVTINNSYLGGQYNESGLRSPGDKYYSSVSQHSFGRAIDIKSLGIMPISIYRRIEANFKKLHALGATTLENIKYTPGWVHIDCREWGERLTEFKIVSPVKTKRK